MWRPAQTRGRDCRRHASSAAAAVESWRLRQLLELSDYLVWIELAVVEAGCDLCKRSDFSLSQIQERFLLGIRLSGTVADASLCLDSGLGGLLRDGRHIDAKPSILIEGRNII